MTPELQKGQYIEKRFQAAPDETEVKDLDEEGAAQIRMPVSSTAEDRDGDEFSRRGLEDMRDQINEGRVPMFLDHGMGGDGPYYGTLGIVGRWDAAEVRSRGNDDVLVATGMPDPDDSNAAKMTSKIKNDMPIGASVGFRVTDYERDEDEGKYIFHGVDLLEISQVGIPSNPLTVNDGADLGAAGAKALAYPLFQRDGADDERLDDLDARFDAIDERLEELSKSITDDTTMTDEPDSEDSTEEKSEPDTDDESEPNRNVDELRAAVSEQSETVDSLVDSINDLTESLAEERYSEPEEPEEDDKDATPDTDDESDGPEGVRLFVGDDADEEVRKEFDRLKEAADEGEIDLAESYTRLFAEDEPESDDDTAAQEGLI